MLACGPHHVLGRVLEDPGTVYCTRGAPESGSSHQGHGQREDGPEEAEGGGGGGGGEAKEGGEREGGREG